MAFAENIGPDVDGFAGNAFDRKAAAIDTGVNLFDAKTRTRRIGRSNVPGVGD